MTQQLTQAQIAQQDKIDGAIHDLIINLIPPIADRHITWDIENIGTIRDALLEVAESHGVKAQDLYPGIDTQQQAPGTTPTIEESPDGGGVIVTFAAGTDAERVYRVKVDDAATSIKTMLRDMEALAQQLGVPFKHY